MGLGTLTFGNDWGWGAAKDESQLLYNAFRDSGGRFVDTANILKALEEASQVELGFPYGFYAKEMVRTLIYGGMRDQIAA